MPLRGYGGLFLAQDQVHGPAAPYMLTRLAAMVQNVLLGATRFFKGVSKDGEMIRCKRPGWQDAVLIGGCSQSKDSWPLPCSVQRYGAEGVAEDIPESGY